MSKYSEIIEEHQFHDRVKHATREILARIEEGELEPVVQTIQCHPFPKFIRFDELISKSVSQKDVGIFDAVLDYIDQNSVAASYNKHILQSMIFACQNDFVHALNCNPQWNAQHITPFIYLDLLKRSTQHNSPQCLQFTLTSAHTLKGEQWLDLVKIAVVQMSADTLDVLLSTRVDIEDKDRDSILSFVVERFKPLQHVMFDHFSLKDILLYTPMYQHDEVTHLYETHSALRSGEQKIRIESQMVSHHRFKERKL